MHSGNTLKSVRHFMYQQYENSINDRNWFVQCRWRCKSISNELIEEKLGET